ncbi:hypothetical protein GCM10012319_45970 [Comamonas sp. KCTC 72670]|nr:hypothetical protein GCM10012319_45970 [Comamonas sp. KCTC 72670]
MGASTGEDSGPQAGSSPIRANARRDFNARIRGSRLDLNEENRNLVGEATRGGRILGRVRVGPRTMQGQYFGGEDSKCDITRTFTAARVTE